MAAAGFPAYLGVVLLLVVMIAAACKAFSCGGGAWRLHWHGGSCGWVLQVALGTKWHETLQAGGVSVEHDDQCTG